MIKSSLDSKLQVFLICSIKILNILAVTGKNQFFENSKLLNPVSSQKVIVEWKWGELPETKDETQRTPSAISDHIIHDDR